MASSVTGATEEAGIRLQSPSSCPSNPRARRVTGRECLLISCVMRPVLTAAESAVMHIISAEADTILSIQYTQYRRYRSNNRPFSNM